MRSTTLRRPLVPLALAAALALSACGGGETATFDDTQEQQQVAEPADEAQEAVPDEGQEAAPDEGAETAGAQGAAEEPGDDAAGTAGDQAGTRADNQDAVTEQSAAAAGVNLAEVGEPIGTATIPAAVDGDDEATMDVALHGLRREGNTLVGIFSFRVNSEFDGRRSLFSYLGGNYWNPFLVDPVNLTRHDVLRADGRASLAMTSDTGTSFAPGTTLYGFATFAAPPEDVTSMTVHLVDGAPAIPEVEIR